MYIINFLSQNYSTTIKTIYQYFLIIADYKNKKCRYSVNTCIFLARHKEFESPTFRLGVTLYAIRQLPHSVG